MTRRDWPAFLWLYLANLAIGLLATAGFASQVGGVLNPSLESQHLARGFDVSVFFDLLLRPEVTPRVFVHGSVLAAILFALVTLFLTPGIVQSFLSDEHLRMGPFFQACGRWYWRFFGFEVLALLLFGFVLGVLAAVRQAVLGAAEKSPDPKTYFYVALGTLLVMWLVAVVLRLWFDLVQFSMVHTGKFWRSIPGGLGLLCRGFFRLFWIYFSITLVGWLGLVAGLWLWMKLPPERVGLAFLVGQAILIVWLATRYWQRAAEALWFREHAPALATVEAVPPAPEPIAVPPEAPASPLPV
jgi:hypothetical protein